MTLAATKATIGFELVRNPMHVNPVPYELTPNTAFVKGDMVVDSAGKIAAAAANATNVRGVMAASYTTTDNPAGARTFGLVWDHPDMVFRCTFSDQRDSTCTGGTTTTAVDSGISGSDDDWNGAYFYCYQGTNAGYVGTVKDYTATSGTFTFEKAAPAAFDTTSKYILLGAAGGIINVGSIGVNLKDANTVDGNATTAAEAGPLECLAIYPKDLMMDVRIKKHVRG